VIHASKSKGAGPAIFRGEMPRKTHANRARAENLCKWQKQVTRPTAVDAEDNECMNLHPCLPNSHTHPNPDASSCRQDDITSDPELLDIIVALRGAARYANRSARYIDAYLKGLTGADAIWVNRKYRGHRTLPANILSEIKKANSTT
jgi:hypothetical protein